MPDCASLSAAARPIPLVAPVMRAVVVIGALLLCSFSAVPAESGELHICLLLQRGDLALVRLQCEACLVVVGLGDRIALRERNALCTVRRGGAFLDGRRLPLFPIPGAETQLCCC